MFHEFIGFGIQVDTNIHISLHFVTCVENVSRMCRECNDHVSRMCRECVENVSRMCRECNEMCLLVSEWHATTRRETVIDYWFLIPEKIVFQISRKNPPKSYGVSWKISTMLKYWRNTEIKMAVVLFVWLGFWPGSETVISQEFVLETLRNH